MAASPSPVEVVVSTTHVDNADAAVAYAHDRLDRLIHTLPHLRAATVEIKHERTRSSALRYAVQVTLSANGTLVRVEQRGEDPNATIDVARAALERKLSDWKGNVYYKGRRQTARYQEATEEEAARLRPQDQTGRILRMKSHDVKPMTPEDAVIQMELLGHDFYFFLNEGTNQHNVVYRRRAGGYGVIEPAIREA